MSQLSLPTMHHASPPSMAGAAGCVRVNERAALSISAKLMRPTNARRVSAADVAVRTMLSRA